MGSLWQIVRLPGHAELRYEPLASITHTRLMRHEGERPDVMGAMREGDFLVHHPYVSFATSVERFVEQAAADPNVLAIKQTVYRTSDDSPMVPALIDATERGKQAVALVELQARFDERTNIQWAKALEEAGVHVVYGQPALKTHAKCVLVVRREGDGVRNYVHIGTGNYHSATARLYTDFGLFTTDEEIGADVTDIFNYLTGYGRPLNYRKVLIAPDYLRDGIIEQIERTIASHSPSSPARIAMKMNALVDGRCIRALYTASQAGVKVDLNVRGICCLRPGLPGISENIRVVSIVGRLLEHSRVYAFGRGGEYTIYIASADLMPRNLDHRVELAVPVQSEELRAELLDTLERAFADNQSSWELDGEGVWHRRSPAPGEEPRNMQLELAELHAARAAGERASELRDGAAAVRPAPDRLAAEALLGGGRARQRVERGLELVDGLEVQSQQVVVAVAHDALLVHDHDRPLGPEAAVGTVGFARDGAVLVGEQRDVEVVLLGELAVRVDALRRDAHDGRLERAEVIGTVPVGAELFRAHGRVVARVEQQHDPLAAMVGEAKRPLGALAARSRAPARRRRDAWPRADPIHRRRNAPSGRPGSARLPGPMSHSAPGVPPEPAPSSASRPRRRPGAEGPLRARCGAQRKHDPRGRARQLRRRLLRR